MDLGYNVNRGMPDALQNRYRELIAGRRAEILTESEHAELLHLTNQVGKHDTERLKYLIELARIRKISLTEFWMNSALSQPIHKP